MTSCKRFSKYQSFDSITLSISCSSTHTLGRRNKQKFKSLTGNPRISSFKNDRLQNFSSSLNIAEFLVLKDKALDTSKIGPIFYSLAR